MRRLVERCPGQPRAETNGLVDLSDSQMTLFGEESPATTEIRRNRLSMT